MTLAPEGRLKVVLEIRQRQVSRVDIHSSRPQLAQRLLVGQTPEAAAARVARLFSLCGQAQGLAVQWACAAAQGCLPDPATESRARTRVLVELAREHLWHLLLHWPLQTGQAPDMASLARLRQASLTPATFPDFLAEFLDQTVYGCPARQVLGSGLAGFDAWCRAGDTLPARLFSALGSEAGPDAIERTWLPPLAGFDQAALASLGLTALNTPGYCAQPLWQGHCAETGALARSGDQPLVQSWLAAGRRLAGARLLARLAELAQVPDWLRGDGTALLRGLALGENTGLTAVETSRGLLIHVVRMADGLVGEYRIVAPTEWNFHPEGALAQALRGAPADGHLEARARFEILALDPCVEYALELRDA